jgi:uncharacterized membrane protein
LSNDLIRAGCVAGAVGCGLMAGLMLAFSTAVMPGLARRPPAEGMAAMQSMNSAILNPVFGVVFGGTSLVCLALLVSAPFTTEHPGAGWRALGALLFLVGVFLVTSAVNVPLNEAIDKVDPTALDAPTEWARFQSRWVPWNHLRAVASTGAAVTLFLAI